MTIDSVFQTFPQLETSNLILRRMQATDSRSIFNFLSDDEVTRYYDDESFSEISQAAN